jgi:aminoglycoside 2'-N-acetyltransferase I
LRRHDRPLDEAATCTLGPAQLTALRAFLDTAFDDFTDDDWAHALGGVHVWLDGPDGVLNHAAVIERTLVCAGQTLLVGYVEAAATAAPHRRQGHGASVMRRIGDLIRERYPLGVLATGVHAFDDGLGWERWRGATFVAGPGGVEPSPDEDGGIMILRTPLTPALDLDGEMVADWRQGDAW